MKINIFIHSQKKSFFCSKNKIVKELWSEISTVLNNDISKERDIIEKGYIVYSIKHIVKNNVFYELCIYYIPKFWDLKSLCIKGKVISEKNETILIEKINLFIKKIKNINKSANKKNNSFSQGKNSTIFSEFEYDYFILNKIKSQINKMTHIKEKDIIYSDILVGEINNELNQFNNDASIFAQNIYIDNKRTIMLINSYLYHKFNKRYISFLHEGKSSQNTVFKDILKSLKYIKSKTAYQNQHSFLAKDLLKRTLSQANYQKIFEKNHKLFNYLNTLLANKANISKNKHYRKVFMMDKVWEAYVETNLSLYGTLQDTQKDNKFIVGKINQNDCRYSRPDAVFEFAVVDAKYKFLQLKNGIISNIDMNDLNKLIRDLIFHSKANGVLVFPMNIDITIVDNPLYKRHQYELLGGLKIYSIEIIELYF